MDGAPSVALQQKPSWGASYASGDPLNPTPAVLAAYGDGVVMAGASADPKVVGVPQFNPDSGVQSEAFLARLQHDGQALWSVPLVSAGMPAGVAVDSAGNTVVTAPYLPGVATVSPFRVGPDLYLAKFGPSGTAVFEKHLVLTGSVMPNDPGISETGLALDSTGAIYLAGGIVRSTSEQDILLAKYDSNGNQVWVKTFAGDPTNGQVDVAAIATVAGDEVVITGGFTGHFDFGGGPLADVVDSGFAPLIGFVARFTAAGAYVSSATFGGPSFNLGSALAASEGGDVLLSGAITGPATVGGLSVAADTVQGSAFMARLDRNNAARWARVASSAAPGAIGRAIAVDGASHAHLTGQLGGHVLVANFATAGGTPLADVPVAASDAGAGVVGSNLAVDSTQSLWVSGTFDTRAAFGNVLLTGTTAGVFLVRLDPGPP